MAHRETQRGGGREPDVVDDAAQVARVAEAHRRTRGVAVTIGEQATTAAAAALARAVVCPQPTSCPTSASRASAVTPGWSRWWRMTWTPLGPTTTSSMRCSGSPGQRTAPRTVQCVLDRGSAGTSAGSWCLCCRAMPPPVRIEDRQRSRLPWSLSTYRPTVDDSRPRMRGHGEARGTMVAAPTLGDVTRPATSPTRLVSGHRPMVGGSHRGRAVGARRVDLS
jgi:hypothetical protein